MHVETIKDQDKIIALIINKGIYQKISSTEFITNPTDDLQLGYIHYKENEQIPKHIHKPIQRQLVGTTEIIIVIDGECKVEFYTKSNNYSKILITGDILILIDKECAHSYYMLQDTTLLEVKQGPYYGDIEKEIL